MKARLLTFNVWQDNKIDSTSDASLRCDFLIVQPADRESV